jgi:hypothetical protein
MKIHIVIDKLEGEALRAFSNKKEAHQWAVDQNLDPETTVVQACEAVINWIDT